jgi:hypothetical protein
VKPHVATSLEEELARREDPATLEMRAEREAHFGAMERGRSRRVLPPVPDFDSLQVDPRYRFPYEGGGTRRGTALRTPDGDVEVERIGKGAFSTVYREVGGAGRVFAVSADETPDKEIVSFAHDALPENPHIPAIEKFGHTADGKTVYAMPHYRAPLRKGDSPDGWRDYVKLKKCHDETFEEARRKNYHATPYDLGYPVSFATVECAKESQVSSAVTEAVERLMNEASSYGATYGFEFPPKNLATDDHGNLVLLDVLFDLEAMARQRAAKQKQRRGW